MLRSDPDYLLLGEIRDNESAAAALEASGSGRVLMSTLHSPDAVSAVTSLRNFGLADHQISSALSVVVAQRLVRRLCRSCRRREKLSGEQHQWLTSVGLSTAAEHTWVPVGCEDCRGLGYDGRIGVFEVWRLREADHEAILKHLDERSLRSCAVSQGFQRLPVDGWAKVEKGITSLSELSALSAGYSLDVPMP
jgi:type II secretory ATPase GspE/PulE/Tfp pilus assembly ATPase PilB-like protein